MAKTDTKTETVVTPKMLSEELNVDAKRIRAYLRSNHARAIEAKNTSWNVPAEAAQATREYFLALQAKKDQAEDTSDES